MADKIAAAGFYVVVPDICRGNPMAFDPRPARVKTWLKLQRMVSQFDQRNAKSVVAALRSKGISAIGAAGFSFGAKVALEVAKSGYVQALVLLHPSFVTLEDIKEVRVPVAVLGAEIDYYSSPAVINQFEKVLSAKPEVDSYVKIFHGVKHGFTTRYDDERAVKSAEEAFQDILDWLTKHANSSSDEGRLPARSYETWIEGEISMKGHSTRAYQKLALLDFVGGGGQENMAGPVYSAKLPTVIPGSGAGSVIGLGGVKAYVTDPYPFNPAILLVSDAYDVLVPFFFVFADLGVCFQRNWPLLRRYYVNTTAGYEVANLRKMADKLAAAGFYVVVPDLYRGNPLAFDPRPARVKTWMKFRRSEVPIEEAKSVAAALRSKGISAMGAAGYSYGAKVALEVAKSSYIQALVLLHPTFVTLDDIKEVRVPIAVFGAEVDYYSPPAVINQFEKVLSAKPEVDSYVKIFHGVKHGWTTRYDDGDERAVKSAEEAFQDTLDWLNKHAKSSSNIGRQLPAARLVKTSTPGPGKEEVRPGFFADGGLDLRNRHGLAHARRCQPGDLPTPPCSLLALVYLVEETKEMAGPQCCANPPTMIPGYGAGSVIELGGVLTYVTGSFSPSSPAILLASDAYGHEAPKLRKLADSVAAAGFYVVVPDLFRGNAFVHKDGARISAWTKSMKQEEASEDAKSVITALRRKGISAIGVAGFCFGAKVAIELAKSSDVQAVVLLHPSFVTLDDIKEVGAPIAVLGAEIDNYSPPALLKQFEQVLSAKSKVDSYVKIFPGVVHGWSIRYKDGDELAVKSAEEAQKDMLDWFIEHVKSSDEYQLTPARL
ncbi:hypothetical protein Tsubulata_025737 [Turnera subulata]|uniref:Dienelactone hydrolase domain-containing protein n=1 Tax=Turnera subulata TaxID=218843 RepID=A0A9Q0J685_9ROSI|nr:hypothetical protein Tsubulata_025737 [Turnera subulata]